MQTLFSNLFNSMILLVYPKVLRGHQYTERGRLVLQQTFFKKAAHGAGGAKFPLEKGVQGVVFVPENKQPPCPPLLRGNRNINTNAFWGLMATWIIR